MPIVDVGHKGYSLRFSLEGANYNYYCTKEFEPKKTIYQLLFERLIDKKLVEPSRLVEEYAPKIGNYGFSAQNVRNFVKRIESALKTSPDKRLRSMSFVRLSQGGASSVFDRSHRKARYTEEQRKVMRGVIKRYTSRPKFEKVRKDLISALKEHELHAHVSPSPGFVRGLLRETGIPPAGNVRKVAARKLPR